VVIVTIIIPTSTMASWHKQRKISDVVAGVCADELVGFLSERLSRNRTELSRSREAGVRAIPCRHFSGGRKELSTTPTKSSDMNRYLLAARLPAHVEALVSRR